MDDSKEKISISEIFKNSSPRTRDEILENIQNDDFWTFLRDIQQLDLKIEKDDLPKELVDLYRYGKMKFGWHEYDGDSSLQDSKENRWTRKDFSSRRETYETKGQGHSIDAVRDRKYHSEDRAY